MHYAMSWEEWGRLDGVGLSELIRQKELSIAEVSRQAADAAALLNPQLEAVVETFDASMIVSPPSDTSSGPLHGVPIYLKDIGSGLTGQLSENGSALYRGRRIPRTDPLITNLLQAGLVPIGRAATAELGMAYDTTSTYQGLKITRNPWHTAFSPGGSSGGSAALVSSGVVPIAHATDGAGSIRIPASLTGLIGLKVTRGRLPLPWLMSGYSNATFTEGALTRTVRDMAAYLDAASKSHPPGNSFIPAAKNEESFLSSLERPVRKLRIGLSTSKWGRKPPCDAVISNRIEKVANALAQVGHEVSELNDSEVADWSTFWSSFQTFWSGIRPATWALAYADDLPAEVEASLSPMTRQMWLHSKHYSKRDVLLHQAHNKIHALKMARIFERYDVLLTPVMPITAPKANGHLSLANERNFDSYIQDLLDAGRYVIPANETGLPAISLPAGLDDKGVPVGFQLIGRWNEEALLLQLARQYESENPEWFAQNPPIHVSTFTQACTSFSE